MNMLILPPLGSSSFPDNEIDVGYNLPSNMTSYSTCLMGKLVPENPRDYDSDNEQAVTFTLLRIHELALRPAYLSGRDVQNHNNIPRIESRVIDYNFRECGYFGYRGMAPQGPSLMEMSNSKARAICDRLEDDEDKDIGDDGAVDIQGALTATEAKEGSDEGFATADEEEEEPEEEEPEEEESEDSSENLWGQCLECNDKGPLGLYCSRCEDKCLIYDGPCSPPGSSQEDEETSHDPFEWEFEENKKMWGTFFPKCGLSEEQVERIETTLLDHADEVGALYDIDEIITGSQGWMEKHDTMFPENKLTELEKMDILRVAVKTVREEVAEMCKRLYQVGKEERKDSIALSPIR
jgi:hypothetical protein